MRKYRLLVGIMLTVVMIVTLGIGCSKKETAEVDQHSKYPEQPIKMIIPYAAGGGTDVLGRAVAKYINLGQPMVIVNMPGASSSTGTMEVYNSDPDGYTILSHGADALLAYTLGGVMPKPVWKDMEMICSLVNDPNAISVKKDSPFNSFQDLVKYAKENPGKLNWGLAGSGGINHQNSAYILDIAGIAVNYVPFDSGAKSRTALMGGHVDVLFNQVSEVTPVAEAGDVKVIAVTSGTRSKFLPDVPTLKEQGIDVDVSIIRGYVAPPNTPQPILEKLEKAFEEVSKNPEFQELLDSLKFEGYFRGGKDVEAFAQTMEPIFTKLSKLILK
jgi:tripartite-type tricarboxylate transporter receptor subunit TctC